MDLSRVINLIKEADAVAIFAGAGMSVDSGLNPFRGHDGLWTKSMIIEGKTYNHLDLMSHHAFIDTQKNCMGIHVEFERKISSNKST